MKKENTTHSGVQKQADRPRVQPFLKWAGGKTQLLSELVKYVPSQYGTYFEPFVGGGALFFYLQPKRSELVNCYAIVRDKPNKLIAALKEYINREDYYYKVRAQNPDEIPFISFCE